MGLLKEDGYQSVTFPGGRRILCAKQLPDKNEYISFAIQFDMVAPGETVMQVAPNVSTTQTPQTALYALTLLTRLMSACARGSQAG